jgi:hypothetical protein
MSSFFAAIVTSLGAFCYAAYDTFCLISRSAFRGIVISLFAALTVFALFQIGGGVFTWSRTGIDVVAKEVVAAAEKCAYVQGGPGFFMMTLDHLIRAVVPFLALAAGGVVFASIACLARTSDPNEPVDELVRIWKLQNRRLERLLIIGAVVLVTGIIFHICWTTWPEFVFRSETSTQSGRELGLESLASYQALVRAFAAYMAAEYTLFLAALFAPVSFLLSLDAARILKRCLDKERKTGDSSEETLRKDLVPSGGAIFRSLIAIFASLATGLLGQLLQAIK